MVSKQLLTPGDARYIEKAIGKAVRLFERGQYTACGGEARKVLKKFPDCSPALQLMGAVYAELGRHDEAIGYLKRTVADDPSDAGAWFNLGKSMQMAGRPEEARGALAKAVGLSPASAQFLTEYGTVSLELELASEAEDAFRRTLTLDPGFLDAIYNLGQLCAMQGRHGEAAEKFAEAISIKRDFPEGLNALAKSLQSLGRFDEAISHCRKALAIAPDYLEALQTFSEVAKASPNSAAAADTRDLILRCFASSEIDSSTVRSASQQLLLGDLGELIKAGECSPEDIVDLDRLTGGLLCAHLKHAFIANPELEDFLTGLRRKVLSARAVGVLLAGTSPQLLALAYQGFLNEFVWHVAASEQGPLDALESDIEKAILAGEKPAADDLYLLGAYRPLHANRAIRNWATERSDEEDAQLRAFLDHVIGNAEEERTIAAEIEQLTKIDDDVSVAVRAQYEENPYPRWDSLTKGTPVRYTQMILAAIAPHRPALAATTANPDVLVAGCGTGKEPIGTALRVSHAKVLAIDLSRASLAYAKRRADELGVANLRFAQADILEMGALEERFDIVESAGVLHHMRDPEAGLRVLVALLKPGGFIQLALYSKVARKEISALQALAGEQGFEPTLEGIRAFREFLKAPADGKPAIPDTSDFYTTSTVRDLAFHVQEHQFTLPGVKQLLHRNGLEFLGFSMANPFTKLAYQDKFPDDPDCLDLDNWDRFEREHPDCFIGMYQLWCRKPV